MTAELRTRELRQAEELEALAPEWWVLWRRVPGASPFQSPAWLMAWWRSFQPGTLRAIAVEAGEDLVGLAPLYLEIGPLGLRLLPIGISLSDHLDVLLDPEHTAAAGDAIMVHLAEANWAWEVMELQELPPGAAALSLPVPNGMEESTVPDSPCPVLKLADDMEEVLTRIPDAQRRSLRLARNRAARVGGVRIDAAVDLESALAHLEALFALHQARWRSRGASGVLGSDEVRRFHQAAIGGLVEAGIVRLYTLRLDGGAIGAHYGFCHGGRALAYLTGFDPDQRFLSPGVLLYAHAIEAAVAEGAREFDFLRGHEDYKYGWGAEDRWNRRRLFRRKAPR